MGIWKRINGQMQHFETDEQLKLAEGGQGSGNFGHAGRPGEVGGSGEGGGKNNFGEYDGAREFEDKKEAKVMAVKVGGRVTADPNGTWLVKKGNGFLQGKGASWREKK